MEGHYTTFVSGSPRMRRMMLPAMAMCLRVTPDDEPRSGGRSAKGTEYCAFGTSCAGSRIAFRFASRVRDDIV